MSMKGRDYLALFLIQLCVLVGIAFIQAVPGYMDADYYYAGGMNLVAGRGLNDLFLWNYLDDPQGLPHPSHTYWMPLPSLLAALGMGLTGSVDYFSARLFFLLIASLIPPLSAWFGFRFSGRRAGGWMAGGLAICSGYYLAYLGLVETFALSMVLASLFFVVATWTEKRWGSFFILGLLAGLIHLTRADGLLWFFGVVAIVVWEVLKVRRNNFPRLLAWLIAAGVGYLLVTGFWYFRNLSQFGGLFPPGNGRVLWLTDYDQLFAYPVESLNPASWLGAGIDLLILQRGEAFLANFQTTLAVQGEIFLLPLIVTGAWSLRKNGLVVTGLLAWGVIFGVMTFVFPLAGSRGGFFHSGSVAQPLFWGLCPVGLMAFIRVGIRRRGWKMDRALPGFAILLVTVAGLMSAGIWLVRVVGTDAGGLTWQKSWQEYRAVEDGLSRLGADQDDIVVVNNPPGYFTATQRRAIVIPNGGENVTVSAARAFGARYLILEENTVRGLADLYKNPADRPALKYLDSIGAIRLFEIMP